MTLKFTSKEISFLKTNSDQTLAGPPEFYFSDLAHTPSVQIKAFEQRLEEADIPGSRFVCAILQVSNDASEETLEKARINFEACFQSVLTKGLKKQGQTKRGIWESLDDRAFVLAFWDYSKKERATRFLTSLKEKISLSLDADILVGAAFFPDHDFTRKQVLANALKAIDHAAFFGAGHMMFFDAVSLNICGDRLYHLGQYKKAIEEYEKGLEMEPRNINLINSLGVCFGVTNDLDRAMTEFKKASDLSPGEIMVIYNIGLIHQIREEMDKAILYLKKAHGINPALFEVELLLGHLLFKVRKHDPALPHLEAAIRLNPDAGLPYRIKGEILLERGETALAGSEFNRAVKLNPSDATALSGYAKTMADQGKNLKIALTFARKSVSIEPDNAVFKERLAFITRSWEQAEQERQPAIKSA